ncbi:hypothetical protein [Thermoleptolyngbya sp. C42_A2020_037]|uniref:hypothetical protein n=1 Tax=Thermoleptolyngbya sp. C42_A2020_037 TaxID=2747799 RepID=UPI001A0A7AEA|nr:hypothetical protein [Thermoleptolyngbya sp. C42_A2020_037]
MQDKSKLTLYVPRELHRKLKIKAAVDDEAMSSIVERAIVFYLTHPHVVDEVEASLGSVSHGQTHRVYNCPGCESSYVIREGELVSLASHAGVVQDDGELVDRVSMAPSPEPVAEGFDRPGEESLVPC